MGAKTTCLSSAFLVAALAGLAACGPSGPIQIGFLGGLTGPVADLGSDGRNGALLAFEEINEKGGIGGRRVELVIRDDRQDTAIAAAAAQELLQNKVAAVIGPMTSNIALAVVNDFNAAGVPLVSPTVTTDKLTGKNDHFLRVLADTQGYAHHMAEHMRSRMDIATVAVAFELKNRAYTESWFNNFKERFERLGGKVVKSEGFASGPDARLSALVASLLDAKPQALVVIASAVDSAMLAQHLRKRDADLPLLGAEWGATERVIELGGNAVEGMRVPQFFDRYDTKPRYVAFRDAYRKRFGSDPGFPAVAGYDAATVVLASLAAQQKGEPLRDAILRVGRFEGAQTPVVLDSFGDAARHHFIVEIRGGKFLTIP